MRLIDADEFMERVRKELNCDERCCECEHYNLCEIYKMVLKQPTAYDVDKVIKQLEEKTELAYSRYMDCGANAPASVSARYQTQYNERKMCLAIVKAEKKE